MTGDTAVGKSALIKNYLRNKFTDYYEPTVLNVFKGLKDIQGKQLEIEIYDTSGDEHKGVCRQLQYMDADAFMICVDSNSEDTLSSVAKWKAEIMEIEPKKPISLIMTKADQLKMIKKPVTKRDILKKFKD